MKKKAKAAKKKVQPVPAGYGAVIPYLSVRGAAQAIQFYTRAFGARETVRMPGPDGKIGHAEVRIGDTVVMLSDEYAASHHRPRQRRRAEGGRDTAELMSPN